MTEEQARGTEASEEEQATEGKILGEIQSLGHQLATAIQSLWESEDTRRLRRELGDGFVELGRQIETAVKSAQESEAAKQFGEQVKETVEKARESDIATKLEESLVAGLRELNTQIGRMVDSFEEQVAAEQEPEAESES